MATLWYVSNSGSDSNTGASQVQAYATVGKALSSAASGDTIAVQTGTYTITATLNITQANLLIQGYGTTPGDNGTAPLITTATNSTVIFNTGSTNSGTQTFQNLSLSNTAGTSASCIWQLSAHGTTQAWVFVNCTFNGFSVAIDSSDGTPDDVAFISIINCLIENSTSVGLAWGGNNFGALCIFGSTFKNNARHLNIGNDIPVTITQTIFAGSTSSFGLNMDSNDATVFDSCTFFGNVNSSATVGFTSGNTFFALTNNIFYGNTGPGLAVISPTGNGLIRGLASSCNNAFGGNTGGNGWPGSTGDVALTANPFTNSSSGDFSLNSTSGGGAACKGAGFPGAFPGGTSTGHIDIGAVQSSSGGGGGGGNVSPVVSIGMTGGMRG
jgi:hypothetical protein